MVAVVAVPSPPFLRPVVVAVVFDAFVSSLMIARLSRRERQLTASTARESLPRAHFCERQNAVTQTWGKERKPRRRYFSRTGERTDGMDVYGRKNGRTHECVRPRPAGSAIREALATSHHAPERGSISRLGATRRSHAAVRSARLGNARGRRNHVTHKRILFGPISHLPCGLPLAGAQWNGKIIPRREIFIEIFCVSRRTLLRRNTDYPIVPLQYSKCL